MTDDLDNFPAPQSGSGTRRGETGNVEATGRPTGAHLNATTPRGEEESRINSFVMRRDYRDPAGEMSDSLLKSGDGRSVTAGAQRGATADRHLGISVTAGAWQRGAASLDQVSQGLRQHSDVGDVDFRRRGTDVLSGRSQTSGDLGRRASPDQVRGTSGQLTGVIDGGLLGRSTHALSGWSLRGDMTSHGLGRTASPGHVRRNVEQRVDVSDVVHCGRSTLGLSGRSIHEDLADEDLGRRASPGQVRHTSGQRTDVTGGDLQSAEAFSSRRSIHELSEQSIRDVYRDDASGGYDESRGAPSHTMQDEACGSSRANLMMSCGRQKISLTDGQQIRAANPANLQLMYKQLGSLRESNMDEMTVSEQVGDGDGVGCLWSPRVRGDQSSTNSTLRRDTPTTKRDERKSQSTQRTLAGVDDERDSDTMVVVDTLSPTGASVRRLFDPSVHQSQRAVMSSPRVNKVASVKVAVGRKRMLPQVVRNVTEHSSVAPIQRTTGAAARPRTIDEITDDNAMLNDVVRVRPDVREHNFDFAVSAVDVAGSRRGRATMFSRSPSRMDTSDDAQSVLASVESDREEVERRIHQCREVLLRLKGQAASVPPTPVGGRLRRYDETLDDDFRLNDDAARPRRGDYRDAVSRYVDDGPVRPPRRHSLRDDVDDLTSGPLLMASMKPDARHQLRPNSNAVVHRRNEADSVMEYENRDDRHAYHSVRERRHASHSRSPRSNKKREPYDYEDGRRVNKRGDGYEPARRTADDRHVPRRSRSRSRSLSNVRKHEGQGDDRSKSPPRRRRTDSKESGSSRRRDANPPPQCGGGGDDPSSGDDSGGGDEHSHRGYRRSSGQRRQRRPPRRRDDDPSSSPDSSDRHRHRKRSEKKKPSGKWMRPDKFDGKGSFETFLYQFENCAKYNEWSWRDKVAYLRWSLTGSAAQLLWGTEDLNYIQLLDKLRNRFSGKGLEEKFQTELRCRRRAKGETLREVSQDVQRLMTLAYPGEKSALSEHIARDAFLSALDDPELELKVREREPADLDTAVKLAQRFEVFKAAVETSSHGRHRMVRQVLDERDEEAESVDLQARLVAVEKRLLNATLTSTGKVTPQVPETQPAERQSDKPAIQSGKSKRNRAVSNDDKWKEEMAKKLEDLQAAQLVADGQAQRMTAENDALNKEVGRLRHLEQVRSAPAWGTSSTERQQQAAAVPASWTPSRPPPVCFNCDRPGHFARSCDLPPRQRNLQGGQTQRQLQQQRSSDEATVQSRGVTKKKGRLAGKHSTYLTATIGGREYDCLLDTGSETSLLPASVVDLSTVTRSSQTLKAANGTVIPILGEVVMPMKIGDYQTTVKGLVSQHIAEVMLGIDWLTTIDAVWEFGQSRISIGGKYHDLRTRPGDGQWCRRVSLEEDVIVPARSEMNVVTRIICRPWMETSLDLLWGTEPTTIVPGVHVSRTLLPDDRMCNIPVRVINVSSRPVSLTLGTHIADLEPVEVISRSRDNRCRLATVIEQDETQMKEAMSGMSVEATPSYVETLISGLHPSVPESTVIALESILRRYQDVFSQSETDLGVTDLVMHHIDTGTSPPFRQRLRRYPPAHVKAISQHVDSMLKQGIIESACSPYASNIVLVKKKDSSYRCCIDYRTLNLSTKKDAYPLPRIDACLDAMSSACWFSTLDLRSSYHQVRVHPDDMDKTAFICPRGMYRFRTMPFGLANAGATFQRLMDIAMSGLHLDICLTYLDDIICYSSSLEQHLERLVTVFERLRITGLKLRPDKCSLFQKSVSFLGHVISESGISTDPRKTQMVTEWPTPTCVREVRSFVGLASYYRRFVKNFADIAAPLHRLMKKGGVFVWGREAQESFEALKIALTSPPILAMPNDDDEFVLDSDACDVSIGAILSQKQGGVERVVAYASRALDRREQNYCVTRKELLAVVYFLRFFKQYLLGRHFTVRTDHAALSWLKRAVDPIGQQARWLEQMEEYDFVIEHRPGRSHGNADAMSRRPCPKQECACHEADRNSTQGEFGGDAPTFGGPADRQRSARPESMPNRSNEGADEDNRSLEAVDVDRESNSESEVIDSSYGDESDDAAADANSLETLMAGAVYFSRSGRSENVADDVDGPTPGTVLPWSKEGLRLAQKNDVDVGFIVEQMTKNSEKPEWESVALKSYDVKVLWSQWSRLALRDGLLKRRYESADGQNERWQVVWPKELRMEFMEIAHGGMTGGHLGLARTMATVQSRAYWPTWSSDLKIFMRQCGPCAQYHRGAVKHQAKLQTPMVGEPWERVSVDITGPHPRSSRSNQYIVTLVDHMSKWAEAIAVPNHTAPTVARVLMTHVISRFGAPRQLLTDRGSEFESELFSHLMRWLGIDKLRTTVFKASTNAMVERFHRTLNSMLGKVVSDNQRDWDERLPQVMAAYRASPHSATGFTPNRLFLGREACMPLDLVMGFEENDGVGSVRPYCDYVQEMKRRTEECYEVARKHLQVAAERRKQAYDIRVKEASFKVGEWVWYHYPRRYLKKSPKWQKHYTGPYLITRIIPPVNYVLQKGAKAKPFVVHADKLKRCFGPTPASWLSTEDPAGTIADRGSVSPTSGCDQVLANGGLTDPSPTITRSPTDNDLNRQHKIHNKYKRDYDKRDKLTKTNTRKMNDDGHDENNDVHDVDDNEQNKNNDECDVNACENQCIRPRRSNVKMPSRYTDYVTNHNVVVCRSVQILMASSKKTRSDKSPDYMDHCNVCGKELKHRSIWKHYAAKHPGVPVQEHSFLSSATVLCRKTAIGEEHTTTGVTGTDGSLALSPPRSGAAEQSSTMSAGCLMYSPSRPGMYDTTGVSDFVYSPTRIIGYEENLDRSSVASFGTGTRASSPELVCSSEVFRSSVTADGARDNETAEVVQQRFGQQGDTSAVPMMSTFAGIRSSRANSPSRVARVTPTQEPSTPTRGLAESSAPGLDHQQRQLREKPEERYGGLTMTSFATAILAANETMDHPSNQFSVAALNGYMRDHFPQVPDFARPYMIAGMAEAARLVAQTHAYLEAHGDATEPARKAKAEAARCSLAVWGSGARTRSASEPAHRRQHTRRSSLSLDREKLLEKAVEATMRGEAERRTARSRCSAAEAASGVQGDARITRPVTSIDAGPNLARYSPLSSGPVATVTLASLGTDEAPVGSLYGQVGSLHTLRFPVRRDASDRSCEDLMSTLDQASPEEIQQMLSAVVGGNPEETSSATAVVKTREFPTISLSDLVELDMEASKSAIDDAADSAPAQTVIGEATSRQARLRANLLQKEAKMLAPSTKTVDSTEAGLNKPARPEPVEFLESGVRASSVGTSSRKESVVQPAAVVAEKGRDESPRHSRGRERSTDSESPSKRAWKSRSVERRDGDGERRTERTSDTRSIVDRSYAYRSTGSYGDWDSSRSQFRGRGRYPGPLQSTTGFRRPSYPRAYTPRFCHAEELRHVTVSSERLRYLEDLERQQARKKKEDDEKQARKKGEDEKEARKKEDDEKQARKKGEDEKEARKKRDGRDKASRQDKA